MDPDTAAANIRSLSCKLDTELKKNTDWNKVVEILKEISEIFKTESSRSLTVSSEFLETASTILETYLAESREVKGLNQTVTEVFRCLRNSCIGSKDNQDTICRNSRIPLLARDFIRMILKEGSEDAEVQLCCAVQFIGNAVVNNYDNQILVWSSFSPDFPLLLSSCDWNLGHYTCMVVHNCLATLISQPNADIRPIDVKDPLMQSLILAVMDMLKKEDSEWGIFVLEDFLLVEDFISVMYPQMDNEQKLLVLDVMANQLQRPCEENKDFQDYSPQICESNLLYLAKDFKEMSNILLSLGDSDTVDGKEMEEVSFVFCHEVYACHNCSFQQPFVLLKELEVLCWATCQHIGYRALTQDDTGLLSCAIKFFNKRRKNNSQQNSFETEFNARFLLQVINQ
ncbi:ataxin-10-like isoform X3 [Octopus sinensis]|uniref:Ataxin-10-like isoform X3 n=1 Tax=Octopus sinensis TaxID=2607531 RepID=A0A7E6EPD5_9MOLL|nr:ataxin-10-like isoform X3 [Octopus sinensis]